MIQEASGYFAKPQLYAPSTGEFWNDAHISKGMLEAHLDPQEDGATRRHEFLDQSVQWISQIAPPSHHRFLLDLGCGPGLYAEQFHRAGYSVTGMDLSKRSISYAKEQAKLHGSDIEYLYQNYLTMDHTDQFDVVTLIYCDYAVLPVKDRLLLVSKVYRALRENGKFILDVFTPCMRKAEGRTWQYCKEGGFWCEKPYLCLESVYQYDDEDETELRQSVILSDEAISCYNIWDHFFTKQKLLSEMQTVGFKTFAFFDDVAGKEFTDKGQTICGVFTK